MCHLSVVQHLAEAFRLSSRDDEADAVRIGLNRVEPINKDTAAGRQAGGMSRPNLDPYGLY